MNLKITVFKALDRWETDLTKKAEMLGTRANPNWERAKKETSKVDFTQSIHFHEDVDHKKVQDIAHTISLDIARGRHYKFELV
jgi:hypothetical protein